MSQDSFATVNVIGTAIAALDLESANALCLDWLSRNDPTRYICVSDAHAVMEARRSADVRSAINGADAAVPDGMPLVWIGKLRKYHDMGRVHGPDLMHNLLKDCAEKGYTSFLYGGAPGTAEELQRRMQALFPGLKIVGTHSPPFTPLTVKQEEKIVNEINTLRPDIIWIGISTPKQELQMASFKNKVNAKLLVGVGAAFDIHAGLVRQAPLWMQRSGLQWLFRIAMEPRRLMGRYFRVIPSFLFHVFAQLTGFRKYSISPRSNVTTHTSE